ncbi:SDR family NAD(P)-dependent oxidoreductase [uncultured Aquimarina sp.]|uniref:SDR family NAD(P)-dependent oxidoreductase n=1 Tax=uncultured Aquimarina sp. TaxID=575652 RepID=UPI002613A1C4|nr:SDR family NAD(P)-dependent oxidoreductase [uncultured Aquimarina sp.]
MKQTDMNNKTLTIDFDHDNFILRDHKVYGVRIVPGVTYLDLILRSAKKLFSKEFSVSKVLFIEPLSTTKDYNRKLEIRYSEGSQSLLDVELRSKKTNHKGEVYGEWTKHLQGRLDYATGQNKYPTFDIENFIQNSQRSYNMDEVYAGARTIEICHGEFMQTSGVIYQKNDEELMVLELSELAEGYRNKMIVHPAFLDGSTFAGSSFKLKDDQDGKISSTTGIPYIPFSIEQFEIYKSFPQKIYVYSKKQNIPSDKLPEVISNEIIIYNQDGEVLAVFKNIVSKRIRQPESIKNIVSKPKAKKKKKIKSSPASNQVNEVVTSGNSAVQTIREYLKNIISAKIDKKVTEIDEKLGFYDLGLDSNSTMELVGELENKCGHDFYPTLLFEYQTIEELSDYLLENEGQHFLDFKKEEAPDFLEVTTNQTVKPEDTVKTSLPLETSKEDIAIIGLSGRYPDANNIPEFWENLKNGKDSITNKLPPRLRIDASDKTFWGGFIEEAETFDPLFFQISPREAEKMDPQTRLFLEESWNCVEDSGYKISQLSKDEKVGVFAGVFWTDYQLYRVQKGNKPIYPSSFVSLVANTVSSCFGFKGPSIGLDTQCSSSLTAIHLACNSIRNRESSVAIAGGVNLTSHPSKYSWLSNSLFLSSKGRCESFGEGGDGYVPGEGVGVILLKTLSKAIKDGDQIYGVIKGTAINHDGRSTGFTVPNPKAQSEVIKEAISKAGVLPEDFSYIEAHGTGTSIGDPIEMSGLKGAFKTDKKQYCSLGSVKSNIGHCESAAGISGVTKVLLQMKYKKLVPSLHSSTLNSKIDFKNSAFVVQQKLQKWSTPDNKSRLAGVSSFGAAGSNAHVIIEEFKCQDKKKNDNFKNGLVVLSAKNANSLKKQVSNLAKFLSENKKSRLIDIAYTLQTGREEMEERLAFVVSDKEDLAIKLSKYLEGDLDGFYCNNVRKNNRLTDDITIDTIKQDPLTSKEEISVIAQKWVSGINIDWELLYANEDPKRISLPSYPFTKKKYWIPQESINRSVEIHPLIHQNTSNLTEQRFTSWYSITDFFIRDHKINNDHILPGVVYLQMALIAGTLSTDKKITQLSNIYWLKPFIGTDTNQEINIRLYYREQSLSFDVYSGSHKEIHCKGNIDTKEKTFSKSIDPNKIKTRLPKSIDKSAYYEMFKEKGFDYGSNFKGIDKVYYSKTEALSKIKFSSEDENQRILGIIDSAFQTCASLYFNREENMIFIPYRIEQINLYEKLPSKVWCHVTSRLQSENNDRKNISDLEIYDKKGELLIEIKGFCSLAIPSKKKPDQDKVLKEDKIHLFDYVWREKSLVDHKNDLQNDNSKLIIVAGGTPDLCDKLKESLVLNVEYISEYYDEEDCFITLLEKIKERKHPKENLDIVLIYENQDYLKYGFVSGLFKTANLENPKINGKTIGFDNLSLKNFGFISNVIDTEVAFLSEEIRYKAGKREIKKIEPWQLPSNSTTVPVLKKGGVYVITGGAGGLGEIFASYLNQFKNTTLILIGRSELDNKKKEKLSGLHSYEYFQCDISNKDEVSKLIPYIVAEYGKIDGVIHSAGVIKDSFILKKTKNEVAKVLSPKIRGIKNLDELTKNESLDFFVIFSSLAGVTGNIGQADYASANAYMDNYASYRNELVSRDLRKGKTISINWPLWKDGGMQISEQSEKILKEKWGFSPLKKIDGINVFNELLSNKSGQCLVVYGNKNKINQNFLGKINKVEISPPDNTTSKTSRYDSPENNEKLFKNLVFEESQIYQDKFEQIIVTNDFKNSVHKSDNVQFKGANMIKKQNKQEKITLSVISDPISSNEINNLDDQKKVNMIINNNSEYNSLTDQEKYAIADQLTQMVKESLYIDDDIEKDIAFQELGMDSIIGVELIKEINEHFDLDLEAIILYDHPDVNSLSERVITEINKKNQQLDEANTKSSFIEETISTEDHKIKLETIETDSSEPEETLVVKTDVDKVVVVDNPTIILEEKPLISSKSIVDATEQTSTEESQRIAIVGMSGRYPKSKNLNEFWENLSQGLDCISEVSKDRWDVEKYYKKDGEKTGDIYCKWLGELEDIDKFDPLFFNISPTEAILMDPQHRIFLQECWRSIEDAGYQKSDLDGIKCGTYVGIMTSEYIQKIKDTNVKENLAQVMVGNASSIFAARLAYLLNLKGPAIAVDTACSSSMVSIHLACQALMNGEVDMAVAGGVTLYLGVESYQQMCAAGMLSKEGKCKTFDNSADGFVPGEGAGVVVLKRLEDAISSGDDIKGVIIGTGINQDGKTNGITAPSVGSQMNLIDSIYEKYQIDPETISYVEAHGTGTKLGDPIEIDALSKAYNNFTNKKNFCAIGSVKTNIGHTSAAAGVASLQKVLLQFKHNKIAPSINYKNENSLISFDKSAFYINTELQDWKNDSNQPKRAAISSFGFSGTNSHMVVEEYHQPSEQYPHHGTAIIPISAKNLNRLEEQVTNLQEFIKSYSNINIHDLAYTLQIGRSPMQERIVFLADDLDKLQLELSRYLKDNTSGFIKGNIKKEKLDFFLKGKAGQAYIREAIKEKELESLAQLWVKGLEIDWSLLYNNQVPKKISLPTYPFARERYWVAEDKKQVLEINTNQYLHPLLHQNESNLDEQKFVSSFSGDESFINDYGFTEKKMVPSISFLEMAREAGERSSNLKINQITNINWLNSIGIHKKTQDVGVSIYREEDEISFEVYNADLDTEYVSCTGNISVITHKEIDVFEIEKNKQAMSDILTGEDCYNILKKRGLEYKKSYRGISSMYLSRFEGLSKITIAKEKGYVLSPQALESILQTCLVLDNSIQFSEKYSLNHIDQVNIYRPLTETFWCSVKKVTTEGANQNKLQFDVILINELGEALVEFSNLSILKEKSVTTTEFVDIKDDLMFYEPNWNTSLLTDAKEVLTPKEQLILLVDNQRDHQNLSISLETLENTKVQVIVSENSLDYSVVLFDSVQSALNSGKPKHIVVLHQNEDWTNCGFATGLFKTFQLGNHQLSAKLIGVDSFLMEEDKLLDIVSKERHNKDIEVRYTNETRKVRGFTSPTNSVSEKPLEIREGGVYLITGGAGGLGIMFAEYLSKKANGINLILTGRSELSEEKKSTISKIPRATYYQCDISDPESVSQLMLSIDKSFGKINGVIHSAGVFPSDNSILSLNKASIVSSKVLLPKINGTQLIDDFTSNHPLDFMVYFSSISGTLDGVLSLKMSDYALANSFLNYYSVKRNEDVAKGIKSGATISINWPLWQNSGLYEAQSDHWMDEIWGIKSLEPEKGFEAFDKILEYGSDQLMVLYGEKDKLSKHYWKTNHKKNQEDSKEIRHKFERNLISLAAKILTLSNEDIDPTDQLGEYGFDSILLTEFSKAINDDYQLDIMPTVFFDHPTIAELSSFLIEEHFDIVSKKYVTSQSDKIKSDIDNDTSDHYENRIPKRKIPKGRQISKKPSEPNKDIAIVGMGGLFAESNNSDQLWSQIISGELMNPMSSSDNEELNYGKVQTSYDLENLKVLGISEDHYTSMSRQQKLVFSALGQAMNQSKISKGDISKPSTGVFIGAEQESLDLDNFAQAQEYQEKRSYLIPNKISFHLNLKGPSEVINTSCTSSYVALHRAIQSIRLQECEQAIVGGVNVISEKLFKKVEHLQPSSVLSNGTYTKSFSDEGSGFVSSEGAGVLIIKSLESAERNNDNILAVIKSSSVTHGGRGFSLEAPSPVGIREAIHNSIKTAKVDPTHIDYIEAHGIANPFADAIELKSINDAYKELSHDTTKQWRIGSIKPTIGHPEFASGIASLIKVIKAFQNKVIPGVSGLENINKGLDPNHALVITSEPSPWESPGRARLAALNGYAIGGVNTHIVLQEYKNIDENVTPDRTPQKSSVVPEERMVSKSTDSLHNQKTSLTRNETVVAKFKSEIKEELLSIWSGVLEVDKESISIDTTFFELGGQSINAMSLFNKINDTFNIELPLHEIFSVNTIRLMTDYILEKLDNDEDGKPLLRLNSKENQNSKESLFKKFNLSENIDYGEQQEFEVFHQQEKEFVRKRIIGANSYNMSFMVPFSDLNTETLEDVIEELVQRHESLRTTFKFENGKVLQYIAKKISKIEIEYIDLKEKENKDQLVLEIRENINDVSFDLTKSPLFYLRVVHYSKEMSGLLFTINHTISDALSMNVLKNEIETLYKEKITNCNSSSLPEPKFQYKDYAIWVNRFLKSEDGIKLRDSYLSKIKESIESSLSENDKLSTISYRDHLTKELKQELKGKDISGYSDAYGTIVKLYPGYGASYNFFMHKSESLELKNIAKNNESSLFMQLISVYALMLYKTGGSKYLRFYIPFSNRIFKEFENIVGWLSSEIVLTLEINDSLSFNEFVKQVTKEVFETSKNRFYPYEKILNDLNVQLSILAPSFFNYIIESDTVLENPITGHSPEGSAHFNFKNTIIEYKNGIYFQLEYDKEVYNATDIENMFQTFLKIIESLKNNQEITIAQLLKTIPSGELGYPSNISDTLEK